MAEENHTNNPFNPFFRFGLKSVLSNIAPEFFATKELANLAEIESSFSLTDIINNEKKKYHSSDQGSTSNGERKMQYSNAIVPLPRPPPLPLPPPLALALALPLPPPLRLPPPLALPLPLPLPPPLPQPLPELPAHIRNRITDLNGTNVMYVMCKRLFRTDLNVYSNRLSMPCKEIKYDFLTEIEKAILDTKEDKSKRPLGVDVVVLDPHLREFDMCLKKWHMTTCIYNLMRNWKLLLKQNNWDEHNKLYHRLHIWSFRINDKLHFVLDNDHI